VVSGQKAYAKGFFGDSPLTTHHSPLLMIPGGVEPPIFSVSGRRPYHWTTGPFPARNAERGTKNMVLQIEVPRSAFRVSKSSPAGIRTRNFSFEARGDVRFTTRALSGR
jgi:hypothetical protein